MFAGSRPSRARGLKLEIAAKPTWERLSRPSRARGLKRIVGELVKRATGRAPRGRVD